MLLGSTSVLQFALLPLDVDVLVVDVLVVDDVLVVRIWVKICQ